MKLFKWVLMIVMMVLALVGCAAPPEVTAFFAGYEWRELVALFFVALFGLIPPQWSVFEYIKVKLGWDGSGKKAHYLVLAISLILTVAAMWVTNSLGLENFEFTLMNVIAYGGTLYAASQIAYQRFKNPS